MHCIFCKSPSGLSRSVEHIVPESLGNTDHTLPRGTVCDSCNNYFARKVEKPVLDSPMMRLLRSDRQIANKRRRIPTFESHETPELPDYRLMSRFLAKAALEALAFKTLSVPDSITEIVQKAELDELRTYARYGRGETWPFAYRTLYPVNAVFKENSTQYEVLHEFDIFYTDGMELYFALAILGVEFVINLGGPHLDGFQRWLKEHDYASPLYKKDAA
jgi:hypothetical protein